MALTRKTLAAAITATGGATAAVGVALIYLPAGLIVAGAALAAFGLLVIDVDSRQAPR